MSDKQVKHTTFASAARDMALNGWGRQASLEEIRSALKVATPADAALLELLRIIDVFAKSVSGDQEQKYGVLSPYDEEPPKWAGTFSGAEVGSRMYYCEDLTSGVSEAIIIRVLPTGHCLVCDVDSTPKYHKPEWASTDQYRTSAEALLSQAEYDLKYHTLRAGYAKRVVEACKKDKPLDEFLEGHDFDEEE